MISERDLRKNIRDLMLIAIPLFVGVGVLDNDTLQSIAVTLSLISIPIYRLIRRYAGKAPTDT